MRPKQRAAERSGSPAASRGAAHAAKGLALGLAEVAVLTVVVVGLKAFVPVEALASLYVLAVLPIAVGWGFALALVVAVLSTLIFDLFVTPPLFALTITDVANAEARRELTASRSRIVAAADNTRRRIERDLHDGAQQRLISLALQLRVVQAAVPPDARPLAARLGQLTTELTDVVDELREFARGIHPAILAKGGLRPALGALARRSGTPVDLAVRIDGRLPEPVEEAAYYLVSEALTNAAKHAEASAVHVEVDADATAAGHGVLRVCIHDDGRGGADSSRGSGLVGLKDRVEALGGRFSMQSPEGGGTRLDATLRYGPASAGAESVRHEARQ